MIIQSIELKNFRNYSLLDLKLDKGINILYGDNAQGKTNILDAVYVGCTSRSNRTSKDRELIRFDSDEAHIKMNVLKNQIRYRIDVHLKKNSAKGIAVNGTPIRRVSELFGIANTVMFSPEDMNIIKNGPSERRRFIDMELCQLDRLYLHNLSLYNRVIVQKNKLLKEYSFTGDADLFIDVYNEQLIEYGSRIIQIREEYINNLCGILQLIHGNITDGKENITIKYEPNTSAENFRQNLDRSRKQEIRSGMSLTGPHRDDMSFVINGIDIRHFGSQGQQRTSILSLKLAEIAIVERITGDKPILLLDDVLSELDRKRQNQLLNSIGECQTIITCTGLDDFINNRFHMDKIFHVSDGSITGEN